MQRTPLAVRLELMLPEQEARKLFLEKQVSVSEETFPTLSFQLRFENGVARLLTGVSQSAFSLDRSKEEAWDMGVKQLLHTMEIPIEQE